MVDFASSLYVKQTINMGDNSSISGSSEAPVVLAHQQITCQKRGISCLMTLRTYLNGFSRLTIEYLFFRSVPPEVSLYSSSLRLD